MAMKRYKRLFEAEDMVVKDKPEMELKQKTQDAAVENPVVESDEIMEPKKDEKEMMKDATEDGIMDVDPEFPELEDEEEIIDDTEDFDFDSLEDDEEEETFDFEDEDMIEEEEEFPIEGFYEEDEEFPIAFDNEKMDK